MPAILHPTSYFVLLAFCVLLGLGLVALAWRGRRRRVPRALAGAAAAAGLWFSAFPPLRQVPSARGQAILLTENYSPDTLRQLLRRLGPGTPVWAYGGTPAAGARPLGSLLALAEQRPALQGLHLLGQGLPAAELPLLGTVPIKWHQPVARAMLNTAFWNAQLTLGEPLRVECSAFLPKGAAPAWVCLRAAGTVRDSVRVPAGGGAFRLRYQPKTTGLAVYELLLRQAGRVLATESVPVEITVPQLPSVLLLAATPSFEFKYLKNYLAEAHYPVALRTSVSRGLVQTDFVNQPSAPLDRLTPALLARYTMVVADAATMAALTPAEAGTLQAAIRGGRLGLVVLADAAPLPRAVPGRADFAAQPRAAAQSSAQLLRWPDAPAEARAPLPTQLRTAPELNSLVTGPKQVVAAARRRVGLGFVVVSAVPETFQWGLQGRGQVYSSFWNRLLTAAQPPAVPQAAWRAGTRWPRPGQPLTLHLTAAFPETQPTVRALAGGPPVRLALSQDTRLPEWSTGQFWPQAAGWHQVDGPGRTTHRFYVYPAGAWAGPEQQERQAALAQRASVASGTSPATTVAQPWPAGWFFALFLLAAGYLWLEEKL
ncbi:hypothetical protein [Hymenobacter properus]|uniref:Uncharacterized protein n=1 Tax=Hymenobacter properus TaxID=2791026 RepID=A0A931BPI9_9BACT|nr:hypothetical protein [Hymenobacter properus]MBF9144123.1 hypothetical protein [Hymenobacter properus]MBR7722939.1 hypothetical protein [Microvirga sp. SRT04]